MINFIKEHHHLLLYKVANYGLMQAWNLWKEGKGLELMDSTLSESCSPEEVMRCIHVGLLCVQEHVNDMPSMSNAVFMLGGETTRPVPKQPAFTLEGSPRQSIYFLQVLAQQQQQAEDALVLD